MNLYLAFTRPRYILPLGWLFLADYGVSSAIAEDTFTGVPSDTSGFSSVAEKNLTLEDALHLALQHNPELAAFDKEVRALANYQRLVNEIERLIGRPLNRVLNQRTINNSVVKDYEE